MNQRGRIVILASVLVSMVLIGAKSLLASERLKMATTTSTENSGLLEAILPPFEKMFSIKVDVIAVGTGKAMKLGENGDVDVIFVHDPADEEAFMARGLGVNRRAVMHNDFVLVGPPGDPAGCKGIKNIAEAFSRIARTNASFVSRGDDSGTHRKEKEIWKKAGSAPVGRWYLEAGQGMGAVLQMAHDKLAYTLADRGTYVAYRSKIDSIIISEGDPVLHNPYGVIAVNPARHPGVNYLRAMTFIGWLTSPACQKLIADFQKEGEALFHPDAIPVQ